MNKSFIATVAVSLGTIFLFTAPIAHADGRVNWSVNVGIPAVTYPAYAPVYAPAPVYQQPQVVYQQQPVYVAPAPVYYPQPRVYVQPAPIYYNGYPPGRYWNNGRYEHRHHHEGYYRDR